MDEQKIIEAFHLMWDHFPEPVLLIKKKSPDLRSQSESGLLRYGQTGPVQRQGNP